MTRGRSWPCKVVAAVACMLGSAPCLAETFGSDQSSSWANTPRGRFECRDDASTNHLQTISVGGKLVYRQQQGPDGPGGLALSDGIRDENTGCPDVVANKQGYLVIVRLVQPPGYGVLGYAIINFNDPKLPLLELGQGQDPRDSKISSAKRLVWEDTGVTLEFVGYLADEETGTANTPPPKHHKVRFNFATGATAVIK